MPDIQFEEEQQFTRSEAPRPTPKLVAWVLRMGLAKSEQGANIVLVIVAVIAAVLAFLVF